MKILHNPFTTQYDIILETFIFVFNYSLVFFFFREKIDKIPDIKRNIRDSLTVRSLAKILFVFVFSIQKFNIYD